MIRSFKDKFNNFINIVIRIRLNRKKEKRLIEGQKSSLFFENKDQIELELLV